MSNSSCVGCAQGVWLSLVHILVTWVHACTQALSGLITYSGTIRNVDFNTSCFYSERIFCVHLCIPSSCCCCCAVVEAGEKELEGWGILYKSCKRFHVCWFLSLSSQHCVHPVPRPKLIVYSLFKVITQPSITHIFFVGPVPADGTPIKMISVIPLPIVVIYYIIATMGIVFTLACLIFTTVYRKKKWVSYNISGLLYVTRFGKTSNNAIEHVFMYKLIKINIPINMYTEVIFTTPISLQWKGAWFYGASPFIWYQKLKILIFSVITGFPKSGHIYYLRCTLFYSVSSQWMHHAIKGGASLWLLIKWKL